MTSDGRGTSEVLRWRLPTSLMVSAYVVAGMICFAGLVFGIGAGLHWRWVTSWVDQPGSDTDNVLWGVAFIVVAVTSLILLRRVAVVLSDDMVFIQNMFRSYRVPLSEIVGVRASRYGLYVEYVRAGRHHTLFATAAQGIKDESLFKSGRGHTIANTLTERLRSGALPPGSRDSTTA